MLTGTLRLTAVVGRTPRFAVGETMHVTLPPELAAVFAANGERVR